MRIIFFYGASNDVRRISNFWRHLFFSLTLVSLFFFTPMSYADSLPDVPLSPSEWARLYKSEILIKELPSTTQPGRTFDAYAIIEAPVKQVYDALIDYDHLASFMPNLDKVEVISKDAKSSIINNYVGLPLGKTKKYRLATTYVFEEKKARIEWKLLPWPGLTPSETIRDTTGYWLLQPAPRNSQHTVVRYYVYTDPGEIPFGLGWIVDYLTEESIPDIFISTRQYLRNIR